MLHISNENGFPPTKNGGTVEVRLCRLVFIGLQNRLCGPLLCKKNSTFLYIICILDQFGPSHEVEGHFKPPLCRFSTTCFPFMWSCIHRSLHSNLHLEQPPRVCIAIFIPSSMFWVAGGFSSYNTMGEHNHSDRFRDTQPMTLPYLTLPYLTLPYLKPN